MALISDEVKSFFVFCIAGMIIGILFDIFRIIRRSFKISDIHTLIEDGIFGVLSAFFLIFIIFIQNNGEIRWYMFLGIFIGGLLYLLTISKYFIKLNVLILSFIKGAIYKLLKLIFWPIKCALNLCRLYLNKPFMLIVFNIKKIKNILIYKKSKKNEKKLSSKKDFSI